MKKRIVLISNIVLEPYWKEMLAEEFAPSIDIEAMCVQLDNVGEILNELDDSTIVCVCISFDELCPNAFVDIQSQNTTTDQIIHDVIHRITQLHHCIRQYTNGEIIWFGFEDYSLPYDSIFGKVPILNGIVDRINLTILEMLDDVAHVDLKRLISKVGTINSVNFRGKYMWSAPYSKELICEMTKEVFKQHQIFTCGTKKCIVLDCDNVLWGGVLSEDGIDGIRIGHSGGGRLYQDFQRFLLVMYHCGVILTVCSKNEKCDVLKVFREHSGMMLKEKHISYFCCNWENKPQNIHKIADFLNIGLDSIVFLDDSIFEIEAVQTLIPEVLAVIFDRKSFFQRFGVFNLKNPSDINQIKQIQQRTITYQTNQKRIDLMNNTGTYDEYLSSLNMKLDIHEADVYELERLAELTQRTNKCTNGIRYSLANMKEEKGVRNLKIYSVCLADRFSDLGVVGVIGIRDKSLVLFSLSCRALGRNVEQSMLSFARNCGVVKADFRDCRSNKGVYEMFLLEGLLSTESSNG